MEMNDKRNERLIEKGMRFSVKCIISSVYRLFTFKFQVQKVSFTERTGNKGVALVVSNDLLPSGNKSWQ